MTLIISYNGKEIIFNPFIPVSSFSNSFFPIDFFEEILMCRMKSFFLLFRMIVDVVEKENVFLTQLININSF